jgi:RNA polymerase sigma factor (sigma-70 family)
VLRLRSDEQLVQLLRSGHDEAFEVIHDRYHARLFAYMRQMLPLRQDVEDALQEVFERAYSSLCAGGDRELLLRPWLYRIAHNRCVDHLRRPVPPPPEMLLQLGPSPSDPILETDRREALRRLMVDVQRLPDQQRSALLMRELGGISYAEVAQALGVTIPAVKSLLVRARLSLVQSVQARDTACDEIRAQLVQAYEGRVRPGAMARRHLRDCSGCREFRGRLRGVRRQLLAISPSLGPFALIARLLGGGPGGGAAAACGGSAGIAGTGALGTGGLLASAGTLATGVGHVATIIAATVVTAGGAVELQGTIAAAHHHHHKAAVVAHRKAPAPLAGAAAQAASGTGVAASAQPAAPTYPAAAGAAAQPSAPPAAPVTPSGASPHPHPSPASVAADGLAPIPDISSPASAGVDGSSTPTSSDAGSTTSGDPTTGAPNGSAAGAPTTDPGTTSGTSTSTGSAADASGPTGSPAAPPAGTGTSGAGTSSSATTGIGTGSGVTLSTSPQASSAQAGSSVS